MSVVTRHRIWPLAALILLLLGPAAVPAADAPAGGAASGDDAAKERDIRTLMDLSGSGKMGAQIATQMIGQFRKSMPRVPKEFWDTFEKDIRPQDLVELVVPIYARHFSDDEIKELIRFYESPIGRKLVAEQPGILQESMVVGQAWGRKLATRALEQLKAKGYMPSA